MEQKPCSAAQPGVKPCNIIRDSPASLSGPTLLGDILRIISNSHNQVDCQRLSPVVTTEPSDVTMGYKQLSRGWQPVQVPAVSQFWMGPKEVPLAKAEGLAQRLTISMGRAFW